MKTKSRKVTINFDCNAESDDENIAYFIIAALQDWGGQFPPDDTLFRSLSVKDVKIGKDLYLNGSPKNLEY